MTDEEKIEQEMTYEDMQYISSNGWIRIGILQEIRIYPLETGHGFNIRKAICTKDGLQSLSLCKKHPKSETKFRYTDRVFVPYTTAESGYKNLLDNTLMTTCKDVVAFHNMQNAANKIEERCWRSEVNYFQEKIKLYDIGYNLKHPTDGKIGEVGFISQKDRNKFRTQYRSSKIREGNDGHIFFSNFYPYTLINITSLDLLKEENEDCEKILTVEKFRPNLVIEANLPYCEDEIVDLKIGETVRFCNIVPCTHQFVEFDHRNRKKQTELFNVLKKTRSFQKVCPYLSMESDFPAFGINLEVFQSGEIRLYDDVYAKFRESTPDVDETYEESDMEIDDEPMK